MVRGDMKKAAQKARQRRVMAGLTAVLLTAALAVMAAVLPAAAQTQEQAVKLELYRRQPEDNEKFTARDMLPGDTLTRYFAVRAYHDEDIELLFTADVTEEEKALGDVLQLRVADADSGRVLCEGTFPRSTGRRLPTR